jgi:hypothetical protein
MWMGLNMETSDTPFNGFKDYERQRIQRDIDWMNNSVLSRQELCQRKADFFKFFNEHDNRRHTIFLAAFPELETFWDQCRLEANKDA